MFFGGSLLNMTLLLCFHGNQIYKPYGPQNQAYAQIFLQVAAKTFKIGLRFCAPLKLREVTVCHEGQCL